MSALIYRRAFADPSSLQLLSYGRVPDMDGVLRRLFVAERRSGPDRPDHFYKNYISGRVGGINQVEDLPWIVLSALAERFIERAGGALRIRAGAFSDWQELLPMISPLAISIAFLVQENLGPTPDQDPRPWLERELGASALLAPMQPDLQALIDSKGLNELHMHLNGSTEVDIVWPDAVAAPRFYFYELNAAKEKHEGPLGEFYDQIEIGLRPFDVYQRLRAARRVRHLVADTIAKWHRGLGQGASVADFLAVMDVRLSDSACQPVDGFALSRHPVAALYSRRNTAVLIEEAAFLYAWLQTMRAPGAPTRPLGLALYFNFLVFNQIARISVQQPDEVGFDQFQKYTYVGVRERLEKIYAARFRQLNIASPYQTLTHLEGRLAPKDNVGVFLRLLEAIIDGYLIFRGCPQRRPVRGLSGPVPSCLTGDCSGKCGVGHGRQDAELALVVHFIKKRPKRKATNHGQALDDELRLDLRRQSQIIRHVIDRFTLVKQILRGMDAAANELHAAPEVFAPTFRYLRRCGIYHATFHVGEDFAHLLSGIRAVAEARRFLPLQTGDRVGHATALGVPPALWLDRTGERLMIGQGEHLDNLVFAYSRLARSPETAAGTQRLEEQIAIASARVYGQEYSPALLEQAWRLRGIDILEILELEREEGLDAGDRAIGLAAANKAKYIRAPARRAELLDIEAAVRDQPLAYFAFRERHRRRIRLEQLVEVDAEILKPFELKRLQADVLEILERTGVVIETLPTSNVRIGIYHKLSEHHLFRWIGLAGDSFSAVPNICVGSDDTGIFATSLRNEYAALFESLRRDYGRSASEAIAVLERLNSTGFAHRFRPLR